jgi:hypothetical protein
MMTRSAFDRRNHVRAYTFSWAHVAFDDLKVGFLRCPVAGDVLTQQRCRNDL